MKRWLLLVCTGLACAALGLLAGRELFSVKEQPRAMPSGKSADISTTGTSVIDLARKQRIAPELIDTSSVLIDTGICAVHHTPLRVELMPIQYGFPIATPTDIAEGRSALFPHALKEVSGGCEVMMARYQRASFCSGCRIAREAWQRGYDEGRTAAHIKP